MSYDPTDHSFMTNMRTAHKPAIEATMKKFPNMVVLKDEAYSLHGQPRHPQYFAVHAIEGVKGTADMSEFWKEYDRQRISMGLFYPGERNAAISG